MAFNPRNVAHLLNEHFIDTDLTEIGDEDIALKERIIEFMANVLAGNVEDEYSLEINNEGLFNK